MNKQENVSSSHIHSYLSIQINLPCSIPLEKQTGSQLAKNIPYVLQNTKVHYPTYNSPPLVPMVSHQNLPLRK